jgi:hypothetical protein
MPVFIVFATAVAYEQPAPVSAELLGGPYASHSDALHASMTPAFVAERVQRFFENQPLTADAMEQWRAISLVEADDAAAALAVVRALTSAQFKALPGRETWTRTTVGPFKPVPGGNGNRKVRRVAYESGQTTRAQLLKRPDADAS